MTHTRDMLDWIDAQAADMLRLVIELSEINSGTANLPGLARVAQRIEAELAALGEPVERIDLPPRREIDAKGNVLESPLGQALRVRLPASTADAKRIFLGIHYDTVYPADHLFQLVERVDANTLRGPGVADAKGGFVVLLTALKALRRSEWRHRLSFEVLINSDEEIGSPGSAPLLREAAERNDVGLVFEPALEGGALAAARKGSGNFTLIIRGKSAHAGRDFHAGRNAIHLAAEAVTRLAMLNAIDSPGWGLTVNVGKIDGGGPSNIVPDLAIVRFNVRVSTADEQAIFDLAVKDLLKQLATRDGYRVELEGSFTSPPKRCDGATSVLLYELRDCARDLGLDLDWRDTGGVCDGNKLAAAGLPTIDTLGPRGGSIHSAQEFLQIDSLTERAKLTALLLAKLAEPHAI